MKDPLLTVCPECEAPVHIVIQPVGIGSMDPRLGSEPLYMSQLASRSLGRKDPEAYVSGPHSWRRLIEKKKREGMRVMTTAEADDMRSPREIKRSERGRT